MAFVPDTQAPAPAPRPVAPPQPLSWFEANVAPVLERVLPNGNIPLRGPFGVQIGSVDPRNNPVTQGLADPGVALMQLIGNVVGQGDRINPLVRQNEEGYQSSRGADAGSFDLGRLATNLLNPLAIAGGAAIPAAATRWGRVAQGVGVGGAFGAATPVTSGDSFWGDKAGQVGLGTLFGAAVPPLVDLAKAAVRTAINAVEPALPGGAQRIKTRFQQALLGDSLGDAVTALRTAPEHVPGSAPTAAEAVAHIPRATALAAHQKTVSKSPVSGSSGRFAERSTEQQGARRAALDTVAGTPEALEAAHASRAANAAENYGAIKDVRVDPRSDAQIMESAIGDRYAARARALQDQGRFQTFAAQQDNLAAGESVPRQYLAHEGNDVPFYNLGPNGAVRNEAISPSAYPQPGMPRIPGRYTENIERVPEGRAAADEAASVAALRLKEQQFLESTLENLRNTVGIDEASLYALLDRPSMRAAVQDAIQSASERGAYFPRGQGDKFSIENLQRMKMSLDSGIRAATNAEKAGNRPPLSPDELGSTRDAFVRWLSNRSPDWMNSRLQYADESVPINQMQIGNYLRDKLLSPVSDDIERAGVFAQATRDAPGTIKRATGAPRYGALDDVLTPDQNDTVQAVLADLQRKAQSERLANRTSLGSAGDPMATNAPPMPNLLSRPAAITNYLLRILKHGVDDRITALSADDYLNPRMLADQLERAARSAAPAPGASAGARAAEAAAIGATAKTAAGEVRSSQTEDEPAPVVGRFVPDKPRAAQPGK